MGVWHAGGTQRPYAAMGTPTVLDLATPPRTCLRLVGELDVAAAGDLREFLEPFVTQTKLLELDLSELTFLDSSGIGVFVSLYKALAARGGDLRLVNVGEDVRRPLAVTGLESILIEGEPPPES
jgi:anti-sigma B factor antagonist